MESQYLQDRRARMLGIKAPEPKKQPASIAKQSEKKKQQLKDQKPERDQLNDWFKARVSEMKGRCQECGCTINKKNYAIAIMSIAHVLPKRKNMFPSVATHPENFLELCTENGCHGRYDTSWDDASQMKIWPIVVEKFKAIYPSIASEEKKHIPEILRQEVL